MNLSLSLKIDTDSVGNLSLIFLDSQVSLKNETISIISVVKSNVFNPNYIVSISTAL